MTESANFDQGPRWQVARLDHQIYTELDGFPDEIPHRARRATLIAYQASRQLARSSGLRSNATNAGQGDTGSLGADGI